MLFNYSSLLMAIGFTGGALAITLFTAWLTSRGDSFLLTWAIGAVLVVAGAVSWGLYTARYNDESLAVTSFLVLAYGLSIFLGAARQFRQRQRPKRIILLAGTLATITIGAPFLAGLSGLGAGIANLVMATLLLATAREYWRCRKEAPTQLITLVTLYSLVALTFIICSGFIFATTPLRMEHAPVNWAEDLNALVSLLGITIIGATTLSLSQSRLALKYRATSLTDVLTGLGNRRGLLDQYGLAPVPARTSIVVFDLDKFKVVNDEHGHATGDQVLKTFTQVLEASLRPTDLAVRIGGEEFVLVLPECAVEFAQEVCERVRVRFAGQVIETLNGTLTCTVSAGIAYAETNHQSLDVLLKHADTALYTAKGDGGRNCVRVYQTPGEHLPDANG